MQNKAVSPLFECRQRSAGVFKWLMKVDYTSNKEFWVNTAAWLIIMAVIIALLNVAGIGTAHAGDSQVNDQPTVTTTVTLPNGEQHTTYTYSQSATVADSTTTEGGKPTPEMVKELNASAKALKSAEKPVLCTVTGEGAKGKHMSYDLHLMADPAQWDIADLAYVEQKLIVAGNSAEVLALRHIDEDFQTNKVKITCKADGGKTLSVVIDEQPLPAEPVAAVQDLKPFPCKVTFTGSRVIPLIGWRRSVTQDIVVNADPKRWNLQNTDDYIFVQLTSEVMRQAVPLPTWCAETVSVACPLLGGGEVAEMVDVKQ